MHRGSFYSHRPSRTFTVLFVVLMALFVIGTASIHPRFMTKAEAAPPDHHSQQTLKALQDTAEAQKRQARALEEISRKLGVCECECKD